MKIMSERISNFGDVFDIPFVDHVTISRLIHTMDPFILEEIYQAAVLAKMGYPSRIDWDTEEEQQLFNRLIHLQLFTETWV